MHFAEEWNELHHLQIMESLGGDALWDVDKAVVLRPAINGGDLHVDRIAFWNDAFDQLPQRGGNFGGSHRTMKSGHEG